MDQAKVVVNQLVTAINKAEFNGVDLTDLAGKLEDGVLSEHETAQLEAQVRKYIAERDQTSVADQCRLMANNKAKELADLTEELEANPDSAILKKLYEKCERESRLLVRQAKEADDLVQAGAEA